MINIKRDLGVSSSVVIAITFVLFAVALFEKGFTQGLLIEAGIFLISVKLILITYRNSQGVEAIQRKLDAILSEERHLESILESVRRAPRPQTRAES